VLIGRLSGNPVSGWDDGGWCSLLGREPETLVLLFAAVNPFSAVEVGSVDEQLALLKLSCVVACSAVGGLFEGMG
jgi:hypothetical protein